MAKKVLVEVVTPERLVLRQEVDSLIVPATEGYLGVLPDHAPLITGLSIGIVQYKHDGRVDKLAVSGGFMEVAENKAILLADTAEKPEEIDVARARRAKERAERRLREKAENLDFLRAEAALKRALTRLEVAGEKK